MFPPRSDFTFHPPLAFFNISVGQHFAPYFAYLVYKSSGVNNSILDMVLENQTTTGRGWETVKKNCSECNSHE